MERQNITLSLPKEILLKVKLIAVQRQTSVSGLLVTLLQDIVSKEDSYGRARKRHLALLKKGLDLNTGGQADWTRDDLHER